MTTPVTSYEVFRVRNGYLVRPSMEPHKGYYCAIEDCYVFADYQKMVDKLLELLNPNMVKM